MKKNSLYIHWPFCKKKCPYCDFNSHVRDSIDDDKWLKAYETEIVRYSKDYKNINTIFFGGGTPSLIPINTMDKILECIYKNFSLDENIEISMEANPTSFESKKFKNFKSMGINRISIGIQALNDFDLKYLGRNHTLDESIETITQAQKIFDNFSFDLIYARHENHSVKNWINELKYALDFGAKHMSLYQLTIEPGTAFYNWLNSGKISIPKDNISSDFYKATNDVMEKNGMINYEVSNYAFEGFECMHNLSYWNYHDYIGIGPGAHGRISNKNGEKFATVQRRSPESWLKNVLLKSPEKYEEKTIINKKDQSQERVIMGLRLLKPFDLEKLECNWNEIISEESVKKLVKEEFLEKNGNFIKVTKEGRIRLNAVIEYLLK